MQLLRSIHLHRCWVPIFAKTSTAEEFAECTIKESTKGTAEGGILDSVVNNAGLEESLPEVPAAVSAKIDIYAAALQIGKNQVRKKATWLMIIVLTTGFTADGTFRWSYNVPANPVGVEVTPTPTPTPTSTSESCNTAAPTGINAVLDPIPTIVFEANSD
jgi:hypothetical protein